MNPQESTTPESPAYFEVAPQVWGLKLLFVNVYFVQNPQDHSWVLIDAGLSGTAGKIQRVAETLFGSGVKPSAVLLTHGHFDHRGALGELLKTWEVPVYAHPMELPYLNGTSAYPPADPTVGGGLMAWMSFTYPRNPINIAEHLKALPEDGSLPGLPDWRWIYTPGHSPGHVSFFRDTDRTLLVGDAFVTTRQESAFSALTFKPEIAGPPKYFTPDWQQAKASVQLLSELGPRTVAAGHGKPMEGSEMQQALQALAQDFERLAVPEEGRYVQHSAMADETGTTYIPPQQPGPVLRMVGVAALTVLAGMTLFRTVRRKAL